MKSFFITFFLLGFVYNSQVKSQEILSNIIVLVDFSTSYFLPEKKKKLEKTLKKVNQAVIKGVDNLPLNMAIQFLPIKEESIVSDTICEVVFARRNLAGNQVGDDGISKKRDLKRFLNDCTKLILKQNEGKATDLTGAIRKAVLMANSQVPKGEPRVIVILSDFVEERGRDFKQESKQSLNDFSFALIYPGQLELNDANLASEVKNRADSLKSKLLNQGAKNVELYLEDGLFQNKIANELF